MDLAWALKDGSDHSGENSEAALKSPEFLIQALAGAKVGTWRLEIMTSQVTWDAMARELLDLEPVTSTGRALASVHLDDQNRIAASLKQAIQCGTPHDIEFRVYRKDGKVRWFHVVANPIKSDGGTPRYIAGVVSDITERKTAELASQESERRLQSLIDNLPGAAYRCNVDAPWAVSFISEAVMQVTGYSADEFMGGRVTPGSLVHPHDKAEVIKSVRAAVNNKRQYQIRYRLLHASGEYRWVHE
ncbi:MAG: PAS domain S-box protein, partial [Verrucomicrobiaceae bacterium]